MWGEEEEEEGGGGVARLDRLILLRSEVQSGVISLTEVR